MIDMNKYRKALIILGILIAVNVALLGGTAFSYLNISDNQGESNVTINTPSGYVDWHSYGDEEVSLSIDVDKLSILDQSNSYDKYIEGDVSEIEYYFGTSLVEPRKEQFCDFNLYYEPTTPYTKSSAATSNSLKELTIIGNGIDNNTKQEYSFEKEINGSSRVLLYSGSLGGKNVDKTAKMIWNYRLRFYNLNVNQDTIIGQHPSGRIYAEVISCYKEDAVCELNVPSQATCSIQEVPNLDNTTCLKIAAKAMYEEYEPSCEGNVLNYYYPQIDYHGSYGEVYKAGDIYYKISQGTYNNGIISIASGEKNSSIELYNINNNDYVTIEYNNQIEGATVSIGRSCTMSNPLQKGINKITLLGAESNIYFRISNSDYSGTFTYSISTCNDICEIPTFMASNC